MTSSVCPFFSRLRKNLEYMITSRSYTTNIVLVSHLKCGVCTKCHGLSTVRLWLNAKGFSHRNLTEIYDSLQAISENKQFLHAYDFPPLLAEPDLQGWLRNKHAYYAETIKLESPCFLLPPFIVIVLDSFDFDQMRPIKDLKSDCSWLFFSKLSVLSNFYSDPLFLKAKQWQVPPTDLCPPVPHPNAVHICCSCEKIHRDLKERLACQKKVFDGITWLKVVTCISKTPETLSIFFVHSICIPWILSKHLRVAVILPELIFQRHTTEVPML